MKVDVLKRVGAMALLFIVLIGSMGFSMNVHFCKGDIQSFRIYGDAQKCYDKMDMESCFPFAVPKAAIHKKKCCADISIDYRSSFESNAIFQAKTNPVFEWINYPMLSVDFLNFRTDLLHSVEFNAPPDDLYSGKKYAYLESFLI